MYRKLETTSSLIHVTLSINITEFQLVEAIRNVDYANRRGNKLANPSGPFDKWIRLIRRMQKVVRKITINIGAVSRGKGINHGKKGRKRCPRGREIRAKNEF